MSMLTPDYLDEVKCKINDTAGTVNAIYEIDGITYLDVEVDDRIYYKSPASVWETIIPYEE